MGGGIKGGGVGCDIVKIGEEIDAWVGGRVHIRLCWGFG